MDSKKDKTVSASGKEKKPGPLEGVSPEERLKRYATLFAFTKETDIDAKILADQWDADLRGVVGMFSAAKQSKTLYDDLRSLGFKDDEFPEWWYSPARDDVVQERPPSSNGVVNVPSSSEDVVLRPHTPRNPVPREGGGGRPVIQDRTVQDGSTQPSTPEDGGDTFTQDELNLLASNKIYRSAESGEWFHREAYPDGRLMITPVNPNAELRRLREVGQDVQVMNKVRESMMSQLEITTQSIIKKVALNPNVFWLFSYVTSVLDPDEQIPLFTGDLDDFVSFCVRFAGETYYGVVPTCARAQYYED